MVATRGIRGGNTQSAANRPSGHVGAHEGLPALHANFRGHAREFHAGWPRSLYAAALPGSGPAPPPRSLRRPPPHPPPAGVVCFAGCFSLRGGAAPLRSSSGGSSPGSRHRAGSPPPSVAAVARSGSAGPGLRGPAADYSCVMPTANRPLRAGGHIAEARRRRVRTRSGKRPMAWTSVQECVSIHPVTAVLAKVHSLSLCGAQRASRRSKPA